MKIIITESQLRKLINGIIKEDFKSQKKKFIEQGNDEGIVDKYLTDFRKIKDNKFKELENADLDGLDIEKGIKRYDIDQYKTFKELELVVDYMAGQRNFGSANFQDIKVDGKPIFENNDVEIFYAPNRQSCVEYKGNKPYSWCISRSDTSNMFLRYRMNYTEPSFYFVKRKKATDDEFNYWNTSGEQFSGKFRDKWHFFVIQVLKNGDYRVTSSMNDGDIEMDWKMILSFAPELNGLKDYFKSVPLTDEEKEKYKKFRQPLSDEEFSKLSYIDKEYYIDVFIEQFSDLSDKQFQDLPSDLKNKYINLGKGLTSNQLNMIKGDGKLLKRYKEVIKSRVDNFFEEGGAYSKLNKLFTIDDYELIDGDVKDKFDKQVKKEIDEFLDFMASTIKWDLDNLYYKPLVGGRTVFIPNMFYIKKYASDKVINKLKKKSDVIDFMGLNLFVKDQYKPITNQFNQFLDFIGKSENEFFNNMGEIGKSYFEKIKTNVIPKTPSFLK
jgi:hypothetical protein